MLFFLYSLVKYSILKLGYYFLILLNILPVVLFYIFILSCSVGLGVICAILILRYNFQINTVQFVT